MERFEHVLRTLKSLADGVLEAESFTDPSLESLRAFAEACERAAQRIADDRAAAVFASAKDQLVAEQARRPDAEGPETSPPSP